MRENGDTISHNNEINGLLEQKDVRLTPNRILVARELAKAHEPLSLADLEVSLPTVDKASIFRVLELFSGKDLVHVIRDGSRSLKYELCTSAHHSVADQHVHFYCERCEKTYCLEDMAVPPVAAPEGFEVKSANFLLTGLCPVCSGKP